MTPAIPLEVFDLALAAGLVGVAGLLSILLRLGLERSLLVGAVRTVVQLLLVGHVLEAVFRWRSGWGVFAIATVMVALAAQAAVTRPKRRVRWGTAMAFLTLVITGFVTTTFVTAVIVDIRPWYTPQYFVPLLGMVLGNTLTGLSLCLDDLLRAFSEGRARVEADLLAGATAWEAARDPLADAVRRGMIPMLNAMNVVGLVSLPGMMTGQILQGADPLAAVKYQIVVMFMLTASTAVGSVGVALLVFRLTFDAGHRLRRDKIR